MKDRLDQYTMAQFIDIACGDYSHIDTDADTARRVAESLIARYNEVSDPVATRTRVVEKEKESKILAKMKLYRIILNLINVFDAYDDVRVILSEAKLTNISSVADNERMKAKIEQLLRSETSKYERMLKENQEDAGQENVSASEIRDSFDKQTARLMSHYKFAISHETISASIYASLVEMACRQQRQQVSK